MLFTEEQAVREAKRCLKCKNPRCTQGCPAGVLIPQYMEKLAKGEFEAAFDMLSVNNYLPQICGRTCHQSAQCEGGCVLGIKGEPIKIGAVETFLGDRFAQKKIKANDRLKGKKVAIVGSGPSGLSAAKHLAKEGVSVTIYEEESEAGGVPQQTIPSFRLPKSVVQDCVSSVEELGVVIEKNCKIGDEIQVEELIDSNDYVFMASGLTTAMKMGIEGEDSENVIVARDFLKECVLADEDGKNDIHAQADKIVVLGGGNVAMDVARYAKRMGAKHVILLYRRSMEEMPAWQEEIDHAIADGVEFRLLANATSLESLPNGRVNVKCVEMALGEPDESGRRRPVAIEGSEFYIECASCVVAIGEMPDGKLIASVPQIDVNRRGCIRLVNENGLTGNPKAYAGGDVAYGAASVVMAMAGGIRAASEIIEKLQ